MVENQFTEHYKGLSNAELLDILDHADGYQQLAIEAAKAEISIRQLTNDQLSVARIELEEIQREKDERQQKIREIENKAKAIGNSIAGVFTDDQSKSAADNHIKRITIFIVLLFLYELYENFSLLKFIYLEGYETWDFSVVLIIFPLILLPVTAILFWKKKRSGWLLATIYFAIEAVSPAMILIEEIGRKPFGNPAIDSIFPKIPTVKFITTIFVFTAVLWVLSKEDIRAVYRISHKTMYLVIGITAGIVCVLLSALFKWW